MRELIDFLIFAMNLLTFLLMGYDKRCAQKGRWRISEKALFISAALFGAVGGVIGMRVFRHKTKHWYFRVFFPLMAVGQVAMAIYFHCVGLMG